MSLSSISTSSISSNSNSLSLNKFANNEIILSNFSLDQNNFDVNNNDSYFFFSQVTSSSILSVCKNMGLGDEDIEFLQNHPYKLTIPLKELILPSGKTPHKSKKNQSS